MGLGDRMGNQFVNKFYSDLKNILTKEKLKENMRLPIYIYIASFFFGIIVAIAIVILKPEMSKEAIELESLEWSDLILHNIKVLITLFISGIILYIGPLFLLGLNGFVQGFLLVASIQQKGALGFVNYLALMVPHGIFELPALLFGTGAGIILSKELLNLITFRLINKKRIYEAFLLLLMGFFLFLIASLVETQVTFRILNILQQ